jgi:hypothetical protein
MAAGERGSRRGSFDMKRLLQQRVELVKHSVAARNQIGAGLRGGGQCRFLLGVGECHDGNVLSFGVRFQLAEDGANIGTAKPEIGEENDGLFLTSQGGDCMNVGAALDAVTEVAEAVEELGAGQQLFVQHERQRLHHGGRVKRVLAKCKNEHDKALAFGHGFPEAARDKKDQE